MSRRTDEIEKENRDRKERWINEIIAWTEDIQRLTYDTNPDVYALKGKGLVAMLLNTCNKLQIKTKHIEDIASVLDKDLEALIHNTSLKLNSCEEACRAFLLSEEGSKLKETRELFLTTSLDTVKSTSKIVEQASAVKISLLL